VSTARPPSPLQELADERLSAAGVRLLLKRDDLLHPSVPESKPTGVSRSDQHG
jgi:1-aminocyclopropane-1-carboxylate deaminase